MFHTQHVACNSCTFATAVKTEFMQPDNEAMKSHQEYSILANIDKSIIAYVRKTFWTLDTLFSSFMMGTWDIETMKLQ